MRDPRAVEVSRQLSTLPLFSDIDAAALARLAAASALRQVQRGETVLRAGDGCEAFHIVLDGRIKIAVVSPAGQEKVIELIGPGHSFAEALMFLGQRSPVSAQALVDTRLLTVPRQALMDELVLDQRFALRMLAGLSRRLHGLVQDVQAYALQSGAQRLVGYLLNAAEASESLEDRPDAAPQPGATRPAVCTVTLPVSKATLASRLSLTPEYFSRVLRELEDAGLIEVQRRDIRILNRERLASYPD